MLLFGAMKIQWKPESLASTVAPMDCQNPSRCALTKGRW
jgi:hypothetical protein